jgi:hypothetical protein
LPSPDRIRRSGIIRKAIQRLQHHDLEHEHRIVGRPSRPWPAACGKPPTAPPRSAFPADRPPRSAEPIARQCPKTQPVPASPASAQINAPSESDFGPEGEVFRTAHVMDMAPQRSSHSHPHRQSGRRLFCLHASATGLPPIDAMPRTRIRQSMLSDPDSDNTAIPTNGQRASDVVQRYRTSQSPAAEAPGASSR